MFLFVYTPLILSLQFISIIETSEAVEKIKTDCDSSGIRQIHISSDSLTVARSSASMELLYKDMNILLLGETGVGKSTWINGFANFLTYPTLKEAETDGLICLIPTSFKHIDDNYVENDIVVGSDINENALADGQSCTQIPKSYVFLHEDVRVRLIDTPGIGDTRGIEKDKENFKNILSYIATLDKLHGICILLKPGQARLTVMVEYCIKELLINLHKSACNNIAVCFTNTRGAFYMPGDSLATFKQLLSTNKIDIKLDKKNIYCFDNEAVRYLAAVKNGLGLMFPKNQLESFANSWEKSAIEFDRLLEHIDSIVPHTLKDTLSINNSRRMILHSTKPLAEISANIQANIVSISEYKEELLNPKGTL